MRIRGIVPVLVSPGNEDGRPDYQDDADLLEHVYSHPIGGLWMLGWASEEFSITPQTRIEGTK